MTCQRRRILAAAVVAGLAGGGLLAGPGTAGAAGCADAGGVTVVVDFRSLGGGVRTGCATGDPASGLAALIGAGFDYAFASRQPGFVCRIDSRPDQDTETCVNTPPTTAYWSYWHGRPGGSWASSSLGAGSHDPVPGSVEGWAFGAGQQPSAAPPALPAPPAPPAPKPPGSGTPPPQRASAVAPPALTAYASPLPPPGAPPPGALPPASVSPPPVSSAPPPDRPQPTEAELAAEETSSVGTAGLVAGIAVIAGLIALGFRTARRRARQR